MSEFAIVATGSVAFYSTLAASPRDKLIALTTRGFESIQFFVIFCLRRLTSKSIAQLKISASIPFSNNMILSRLNTLF
jgi:hypothetical protein